jgi:cytochrome c biogenesis protein CcmG, thiol:disulfide interchange protein DsbE
VFIFRRLLLFVATFVPFAAFAAVELPRTPAAIYEQLPQIKGKVVLLDFWASWCGPCRQSFPWMNELQARYGAAGLVVVAFNLDQDRELAAQFLTTTPAKFRIEYDARGTLAESFGVVAMPTSVLIDRAGRVRAVHRGFKLTQRAEREQAIAALLKE